jgi:hypothetical protein
MSESGAVLCPFVLCRNGTPDGEGGIIYVEKLASISRILSIHIPIVWILAREQGVLKNSINGHTVDLDLGK